MRSSQQEFLVRGQILDLSVRKQCSARKQTVLQGGRRDPGKEADGTQQPPRPVSVAKCSPSSRFARGSGKMIFALPLSIALFTDLFAFHLLFLLFFSKKFLSIFLLKKIIFSQFILFWSNYASRLHCCIMNLVYTYF